MNLVWVYMCDRTFTRGIWCGDAWTVARDSEKKRSYGSRRMEEMRALDHRVDSAQHQRFPRERTTGHWSSLTSRILLSFSLYLLHFLSASRSIHLALKRAASSASQHRRGYDVLLSHVHMYVNRIYIPKYIRSIVSGLFAWPHVVAAHYTDHVSTRKRTSHIYREKRERGKKTDSRTTYLAFVGHSQGEDTTRWISRRACDAWSSNTATL